MKRRERATAKGVSRKLGLLATGKHGEKEGLLEKGTGRPLE